MNRIHGTTSSGDSYGSSRQRFVGNDPTMRCHCGFHLHVHTSTTRVNPGRRFISCPIRGKEKCGYFKWLDPELPPTTLEIINSLHERIDCYEERISSNNVKEAQLKKLVLIQMIVILFVFICFLIRSVRSMGTSPVFELKALGK